MRNCGPVVVTLHCLFYFIYILHSNNANYFFRIKSYDLLANKTAGRKQRMGLDVDRVLNFLKITEEKEDKE
jgi:hypothetical protein